MDTNVNGRLNAIDKNKLIAECKSDLTRKDRVKKEFAKFTLKTLYFAKNGYNQDSHIKQHTIKLFNRHFDYSFTHIYLETGKFLMAVRLFELLEDITGKNLLIDTSVEKYYKELIHKVDQVDYEASCASDPFLENWLSRNNINEWVEDFDIW